MPSIHTNFIDFSIWQAISDFVCDGNGRSADNCIRFESFDLGEPRDDWIRLGQKWKLCISSRKWIQSLVVWCHLPLSQPPIVSTFHWCVAKNCRRVFRWSTTITIVWMWSHGKRRCKGLVPWLHRVSRWLHLEWVNSADHYREFRRVTFSWFSRSVDTDCCSEIDQ